MHMTRPTGRLTRRLAIRPWRSSVSTHCHNHGMWGPSVPARSTATTPVISSTGSPISLASVAKSWNASSAGSGIAPVCWMGVLC